MKNKAHFVKKLCSLTKVDHDSPEGQKLYELKVVDLLIAIKQATPVPPEPDSDEDDVRYLVGFRN